MHVENMSPTKWVPLSPVKTAVSIMGRGRGIRGDWRKLFSPSSKYSLFCVASNRSDVLYNSKQSKHCGHTDFIFFRTKHSP